MPRLFVAIPIPDEIQGRLDRLCQGLPGVRWLAPEHRHITLQFVGEVDGLTFGEIGEALTRVHAWPVTIQLEGLGHFPPKGQPRSLWVGVGKNEPLSQLRRSVLKVTSDVSIPAERQKYIPHVTIGRLRIAPPIERMISYLQRRSLFSAPSFIASSFCLYSSHLSPDGADYQIEATYDFVHGTFEQH